MKKFNIILASCNNNGIGNNGKLPWKNSKDMNYFVKLTTFSPIPDLKNVVIMGRKTYQSLPKNGLKDRINIVVSSTLETKGNIHVVKSFNEALIFANNIAHYMTWVIGGKSIYIQAFNHHMLDKIYYNVININVKCDTFINLPKTKTLTKTVDNDITYNIMKVNDNEIKYMNLLYYCLTKGNKRQTRNSIVLSNFSKEIELDVSDSFPILTSKRMYWRGIVEELLFFIRGDTNTLHLEEKKVNIWKGNTSKEFLDKMNLNYKVGDMGPMYGYQLRYYNKPYGKEGFGIDQMAELIKMLHNDKHSRRLLMTTYNPSQVKEGVLYPCHSLILQFYVNNNMLSVKMYQRSGDLFLGVPFNIASTSLLLYIIAKLSNLKPNKVILTFGDIHIYENHINNVILQLKREVLPSPKLIIPDFKSLKEVENSTFKDYKLVNYKYKPSIKARMVA